MSVQKLAACGTPSAYRRHLRGFEEPCQACRVAHAAAHTSWRQRSAAGETSPKQESDHGTDARYRRHLRHREPPCDPCRAAHARREANRVRRVQAERAAA